MRLRQEHSDSTAAERPRCTIHIRHGFELAGKRPRKAKIDQAGRGIETHGYDTDEILDATASRLGRALTLLMRGDFTSDFT